MSYGIPFDFNMPQFVNTRASQRVVVSVHTGGLRVFGGEGAQCCLGSERVWHGVELQALVQGLPAPASLTVGSLCFPPSAWGKRCPCLQGKGASLLPVVDVSGSGTETRGVLVPCRDTRSAGCRSAPQSGVKKRVLVAEELRMVVPKLLGGWI